MALPSIPSNFLVQTANGQIYVSWNAGVGATSYEVYRSLDNNTYSLVSSPTATSYLDTAVTIGTQYYYKVRSVNVDGNSAYTVAQSQVPTTNGEMTLGQLRLASQQRADRVNSQFLTTPEWNTNINNSLFELYDLLVACYGEDYFTLPPAQFMTNGQDSLYPLPDGVTSFTNIQGQSYVPPPFYKLVGVDLGVNNANNGFVTINKFNFIDRNRYFYPNTASTIYGVFNMSYRIIGDKIDFIPIPSANQPIRLWFIPRMTMLLKDTDITYSGVSGWLEYVIVDAAIKALQKEESDVSVLMAQKMALKQRIEAQAQNRDAGAPDTVSDTRSTAFGGQQWGPNGAFKGGW